MRATRAGVPRAPGVRKRRRIAAETPPMTVPPAPVLDAGAEQQMRADLCDAMRALEVHVRRWALQWLELWVCEKRAVAALAHTGHPAAVAHVHARCAARCQRRLSRNPCRLACGGHRQVPMRARDAVPRGKTSFEITCTRAAGAIAGLVGWWRRWHTSIGSSPSRRYGERSCNCWACRLCCSQRTCELLPAACGGAKPERAWEMCVPRSKYEQVRSLSVRDLVMVSAKTYTDKEVRLAAGCPACAREPG